MSRRRKREECSVRPNLPLLFFYGRNWSRYGGTRKWVANDISRANRRFRGTRVYTQDPYYWHATWTARLIPVSFDFRWTLPDEFLRGKLHSISDRLRTRLYTYAPRAWSGLEKVSPPDRSSRTRTSPPPNSANTQERFLLSENEKNLLQYYPMDTKMAE